MQHRITPLAIALALAFPCTGRSAESVPDVAPLAVTLTAGESTYAQVHHQVKSDLAHAAGYTGKGAVVAVLDTGVQGNHIELATQLVGTTMYDATLRKYVAPTDGNGHGTHVAAVVAGSTGTGYSYGVAPDAKILPIKVFTSGTWTASATDLATGLKTAAGNRSVSVINLSVGAGGPLGPNFERALKSAVSADKLIVVAAGNEGAAAPSWPARYAKESWAKSQIIAVGAVDANNQLASFSNRAGDTANWFLVAPGVGVLSAYNDGGYAYMSGTSAATPIVAGAAALLEGAWPQLKAGQVASILFQSATDLGAPGVDSTYGWGLLNAERAMQPIGTLSTPVTSTRKTRLSKSTLQSSVASWSGLRAAAQTGAFRGVAVDAYNRDYATDYGAQMRAPGAERLADTLAQAGEFIHFTEHTQADGSRFSAAISARSGAAEVLGASAVLAFGDGRELAFASGGLAGRYFGLAGLSGAWSPQLGDPFIALAQASSQAAFGFNRGPLTLKAGVLAGGAAPAIARDGLASPPAAGRAVVGEFDFAPTADTALGVQLTDLDEGERWLGGSTNGALALGAAHSRTLTLQGLHRLAADTVLAARFSLGRTADGHGDGLLSARDVRTESFALGLVSANVLRTEDRLALTVSSPLRIIDGNARLRMPVDIAADGETVFATRTFSLAATARELRLGLDYQTPLSRQASLSWLVALRHNADHLAGERDVQAGAIYRLAF